MKAKQRRVTSRMQSKKLPKISSIKAMRTLAKVVKINIFRTLKINRRQNQFRKVIKLLLASSVSLKKKKVGAYLQCFSFWGKLPKRLVLLSPIRSLGTAENKRKLRGLQQVQRTCRTVDITRGGKRLQTPKKRNIKSCN